MSVDIAAPPEIVATFFSDADRLGTWLGGGSMAVRPGGALRVPYPNGDVAVGKVVRTHANGISFTWGYENGANGLPPGVSTVDIEFLPSEKGTTVTLRHRGLPTEAQRRNHLRGWRYYLGALANAASSFALKDRAEGAADDYLAAWAEPDAGARQACLARSWNSDATFKDSMGYAPGREALDEYIAQAQGFMPGVALRRSGPVVRAHGHVMFPWEMVGQDGAVYGSGWNIGELDASARFLWMVGMAAPR